MVFGECISGAPCTLVSSYIGCAIARTTNKDHGEKDTYRAGFKGIHRDWGQAVGFKVSVFEIER